MIDRKSMAVGTAGLVLLLGAAAPPEGATYVALGSSFAAGPGIAEPAADGTPRCAQSIDNYPRQLARSLKLKLVDRSCSGATTADILQGGPLGLPPQLDGLTPQTRLITVTIGGNDVRYMADLGVAACRHRTETRLDAASARPCAPPADFVLDQAFATTEANLKAIAAEARRRSPQARLVFVDYVTVLPPGPVCPGLAISDRDADDLRARAARLARLTEQVAKQTGANLVKASELTEGHDACAADPWVNGFVEPRATPGWGLVSFHPRLPAMTAIAGALHRTLGD